MSQALAEHSAYVAGTLDALIEAVLFAADKPMAPDQIAQLLVEEDEQPDSELKQIVLKALANLQLKHRESGIVGRGR